MSHVENPFPSAPPPPPPASSRTWLWIVLGILLVLMLVCGGVCGGLFFVGLRTAQRVEGELVRAVEEAAKESAKESVPMFMESFEKVENDPQVIDRLGEPIDGDNPRNYQGFSAAGVGSATADYDISGPKGTATVHVVGKQVDGQWHFETLKVTFADGQSLELAEQPPPIQLE